MELTAEAVSNIIRDCLPDDDVLTAEQRDKLRSGGTIDGYSQLPTARTHNRFEPDSLKEPTLRAY